MRLMVEANLEQVIRRQMAEVDTNEVRNVLNERVRDVFGKSGGKFSLVPFPAGPYEVPDEVGDGRPFLVVMGYEALAISADPKGLPSDIAEIFKHKGTNNDLREYRNNLVFVVADERHRQNMKDRVRRHLALLRDPQARPHAPARRPPAEEGQRGGRQGPVRGRPGDPARLPPPVLPVERPDARSRPSRSPTP